MLALDKQLQPQDKRAILWDYTNTYFTWPLLAAGGGYAFKQKPDGTSINFRYGDATRGGNESYHLDLASGLERGAFTAVFGAELIDQRPLWAFDRSIQDSTLAAPTARSTCGSTSRSSP